MGNVSEKQKRNSIELEEEKLQWEREQTEKEERKKQLAEVAEIINHNAKAYLARKEWDNLRKTIDRRRLIAGELYDTESNYVKNLGHLSKIFYKPLLAFATEAEHKSKRSFAHRKSVKTDFAQIEEAYRSSTQESKTTPTKNELNKQIDKSQEYHIQEDEKNKKDDEKNKKDDEKNKKDDEKNKKDDEKKKKDDEKKKKDDEEKKKEDNSHQDENRKDTTSSSSSESEKSKQDPSADPESKEQKAQKGSTTESTPEVSILAEEPDLQKLVEEQSVIVDMPGLTLAHVRIMFSQLEVILLHNQEVLARIETVIKSWEWTSQLGPVFSSLSAFLRVYIQYVNNYSQALDTFNNLNQTIPQFEEWIRKMNNKKEVALVGGFEGLLIMPIQRIPRYVLLLEDLLRATPEGHIDRESLVSSLAMVKSVASEINEKKRGVENFQTLVAIYNRLDPPIEDLCEAHREFQKETKFQEYDKDMVTVYLFNDLLIKTRPKGQKEKAEAKIQLYQAEICDLADDKKIKLKNGFLVTAPDTSMIFMAKTAEDKKEWIKSIHKNIKEQRKKHESFTKVDKSRIKPEIIEENITTSSELPLRPKSVHFSDSSPRISKNEE